MKNAEKGNTVCGEIMLDERTSLLLNKINEICGEGGFKIAEEGELLAAFPKSAGVEAEELRRILRYLEERRYIDVKYAEDGVYCLCPLPDGRLYFETAREQKAETVRRRRGALLLSAVGAFIGAALGSLLVWAAVFLSAGQL